MMHYGYGLYGLYGGGMIFMMLIPLLLIGVIVYAAIRLSTKEAKRGFEGPVPDNAMAILNERLVRGEISDEEYLQKKTLLQKR